MSTGLLVLCSPLNQIIPRLGTLAKVVTQHVRKTLYVHLELTESPLRIAPQQTQEFTPTSATLNRCQQLISKFYIQCFNHSQSLDVRFLLGALKKPCIEKPIILHRGVDVILTDCNQTTNQFQSYLNWRFSESYSKLPVINIFENEHFTTVEREQNEIDATWKSYDNVVLGGTFDRLHDGHRLLLSEAVLRCEKRLTVGVTSDSMIKGKLLGELVEPFDTRVKFLRTFLTDIDESLNYYFEAINDAYGPAIVDPELQCIVVSKETRRGGEKVNEQRLKKGMVPLAIHEIDLLNDDGHAVVEEEKISSSTFRMRSLGQRRLPPYQNLNIPKFPYVIGLTGGIASGKSSISNRLKDLGAATINCDTLGHLAYGIGTTSHSLIVEKFGSEVVSEDGTINRAALGKIVFSDPSKMKLLNGIVWPEIRRMVQEQIMELGRSGEAIVVVEAAVLLESGWDNLVHEIWASIIPDAEAIKRLKSRNNLNEKDAQLRLDRQITNTDRVKKATVIFSTLWEPEYTQKQVETAWEQLNDAISGKAYPTKL